MRKFILLAALTVATGCGVSRAPEEGSFRYYLEGSYESEMYRQDSMMLIDEKGDAMLIRKVDTAMIKLTSAIFRKDLPQASPAPKQDFRIGRKYSLDNDALLEQFADVIRRHYPDIKPYIGEEHAWSPAAREYMRYGYLHRLWRHVRGKQEDFPAPLLGRSKLLVCLAIGWTSRYCTTGTEQALTERIMTYPDGGLHIADLFEESYVLNGGDLYLTLLACENVLAGMPHRPDRASDPLQRKLAYIRNDSAPLGDNYGAWYHFFGITLYGMIRPKAVSVFVANTESVGSFFMEGPDRQESLINHYGALFGYKLGKMIRSTLWDEASGRTSLR